MLGAKASGGASGTDKPAPPPSPLAEVRRTRGPAVSRRRRIGIRAVHLRAAPDHVNAELLADVLNAWANIGKLLQCGIVARGRLARKRCRCIIAAHLPIRFAWQQR